MTSTICSRHVKLTLFQATLYCSVLAVTFVASLYYCLPAEIQRRSRHDPSQIRWRSLAASVVCVVALISYPHLFCEEWKNMNDLPLAALVQRGVLATGGVLFHTALLYLGSIVRNFVEVYDSVRRHEGVVSFYRFGQVFFSFYVEPTVSSLLRPRNATERWTQLRNLIVAPVTEEIVFRACMVPALRSTGMTFARVALTAPLFFGFAHGHHALLKVRQNQKLSSVLLETIFQFTYTSVFGAYVSFAFLRTGSICAVTVCHTFCNAMGLPDLLFLTSDSPLHHYRPLLLMSLLLGMISFVTGMVAFDLPPTTLNNDANK